MSLSEKMMYVRNSFSFSCSFADFIRQTHLSILGGIRLLWLRVITSEVSNGQATFKENSRMEQNQLKHPEKLVAKWLIVKHILDSSTENQDMILNEHKPALSAGR